MTYMPNTIFSCQTTLKKAKFLEFGLKMPTWQPCVHCATLDVLNFKFDNKILTRT